MIKRLYLMLLICLMYVLASCSHVAKQAAIVEKVSVAKESAEESTKEILLVNSNASVPRYLEAQLAFQSTEEFNINVVDLAAFEEPVESLWDILNERGFEGIYAIGAKALSAVDHIAPNSPVVFSSVLNWRKFEARDGFLGIASEISPQAQLTWFKYIFPELDKLGVIYSSQNEAMVKAVIPIAEKLGIELVLESVNASEHVEIAVSELAAKVKQLWLVSDSVVLPSSHQVKKLFEMTKKLDMSVFCYNELFINFGALLSVDSDRSTIGYQAGLIMSNLLTGKADREIRFPAGSRIVINREALKESAMTVNQSALESITDIR